MERENRYLVVKYKDILKYLVEADQMSLMALVTKIEVGREEDGKKSIECVVVEHDWPEYLDVWSMIAARVDGVGIGEARMRQYIKYDPDYETPNVEFSGAPQLHRGAPLERKVMPLETGMSDYKRVPTSAEVWAVIRARHPEMCVFGTYSAPDGDEFGDPSKGKMFTSYGFEHGDFPVIEAQTTWDIAPESPSKRNNQQHEYWLCLPKREDA